MTATYPAELVRFVRATWARRADPTIRESLKRNFAMMRAGRYAHPSRDVLPETMDYDMQPYGRMTLGNLTWGEYNGHVHVTGTVLVGTETSRLFQHSLTKSIVGQRRTIYGVKARELVAREAIRVAM